MFSNLYKKFFIKTLGCQMNEYDSLRIHEVLECFLGITKTNDCKKADIIIINTCSVREKAQEKLFHELGRWRSLKQNKSHLIICVGGCVASQEGRNIVKRVAFVNIIFGPQNIHRLPYLIKDFYKTHKLQIDISFPELEKFDYLPAPISKHVKSFVSIMEGCDKYCSYCIVPFTRGHEFSRPFDDVIAECALLAEQGTKEITLLGQNVNHYLGMMQSGKIADLALLIHYIAAIDNIQRIRFITSHPSEFSDSLINVYSEVPKLANHLHLPVQHGSDRMLKAMNRNYTVMDFKQKIYKLRNIKPDISISSDFIVGFPGETEDDFQDLINLIKSLNFDNSFSFMYSKRPGTHASNFTNEVPLEIKKQRLSVIQSLLKNNALSISRRMLGYKYNVLVDGFSKKDHNMLIGKTDNNRTVSFSGNSSFIGKFVKVNITQVKANHLFGILY